VDGNNFPDIVVANDDGQIGVLLGHGNGQFDGPVVYSPGGSQPTSTIVADLNHDGNLDLIVANNCALGSNCGPGAVGVLMGNGNGTFQRAVTYSSGGYEAFSAAIADVNRDGILDLVVDNACQDANCTNGNVAILLGHGDGTFGAATAYSSDGYSPFSVAVADVNGDGLLDVVVANSFQDQTFTTGAIAVLLAKPDGTFASSVSYGSGGKGAVSLEVVDVNHDGKLDVLVANQCALGSGGCLSPGALGVLLGNGDGTFQPAASYYTGGYAAGALAVADVNGDGFPDAIAGNHCDPSTCTVGMVGVLLGKGDGTFQPATSISVPLEIGPSQLAIADFNGDGKLDIASGDANFLLLGNGDGTFQSPLLLGAGGPGIAAGDFDGNGSLDLAVGGVTILLNRSGASLRATTTALSSSLNPSIYGQSVTFSATVTSAAGTPTGTVTFSDGAQTLGAASLDPRGVATIAISSLNVGGHSIQAAYSGDSQFKASNSSPLAQIVTQVSSATRVSSSLNPSTYGQPVTLSATVTPLYGGVVTGTVTFFDGSHNLGVAGVTGNVATLSAAVLNAGTHSIKAQYSGDANVHSSRSAVFAQSVNVAATTTVLDPGPKHSHVGETVTYTAQVTSQYGGVVTGYVLFKEGRKNIGKIALTNGQATFNKTYTRAGVFTIQAFFTGDKNDASSHSEIYRHIVDQGPTRRR